MVTFLEYDRETFDLANSEYDRFLIVSCRVEELRESEIIRVKHHAEAIHYRSLDKENWASQG